MGQELMIVNTGGSKSKTIKEFSFFIAIINDAGEFG